jgi:hypothetical protein
MNGAVVQPTQGVSKRAEIESLLVEICTPPPVEANVATRGSVVRPLQVTVTAPGINKELPEREMVNVFDAKDEDQDPDKTGYSMKHALITAAEIRLLGKIRVIASELNPEREEEIEKFN